MARKMSSEGLAPASIAKFITTFHNGLDKCAPPNFNMASATVDELREFIINIQKSKYSIKTQAEIKKAIKKYYKGNDKEHLVKFFKTSIPQSKKTVPNEGDMLTLEEVERMITACKNTRDKAIISLLAESGMRIGELGALQIKHVNFDNHGAVITVPSGKTGARRIRVVQCERHLRQWLMDHPHKDNDEDWLWINLNASQKSALYDRMDYECIRMMIVKKAIDAQVRTYKVRTVEDKKSHKLRDVYRTKVHPHLFRHTAATRLAKFMTEQQLKIYLGWTAGSDMASVYVHLSGKDVDDTVLKMNGLQPMETQVESVRCQACGRMNASESSSCNTCFRPLSVKMALVNEEREKHASKVLEAIMSGELSVEEIKAFTSKQKKAKVFIEQPTNEGLV